MARFIVWTCYHVYLFKSSLGRLACANSHLGPLTVPEKVLENGPAMISAADRIFLNSDIFLTKTNHLERVFKYRTFQAYRSSIKYYLRETALVTRRRNSMTCLSSSRRNKSI